MGSRAQRFLDHLDRLSGDVEPRFLHVESTNANLNGVTAITYSDLPEEGMSTTITYGLSLAAHPDWRLGKPELCIAVQSEDHSWAWAVAHIVEQMRGHCPFSYGTTIGFGEPIASESLMTAFLVFAPSILDREDWSVDLAGEGQRGLDVVHLAAMYPIHEVERQYVDDHGVDAFWGLDWDPYDVTRSPAV